MNRGFWKVPSNKPLMGYYPSGAFLFNSMKPLSMSNRILNLFRRTGHS
jgi:hypothetical protein